jgi:PAS domain S-box-containing protein
MTHGLRATGVSSVKLPSRESTDEVVPNQRSGNASDLYFDLVEHSHDLLCTHDLSGNLLSVNPTPARLLGYEVEELLRISMRDLVAPEYRDQFDEYLVRVQREGVAKGYLALVTKSGERRIWEYNNTLRTDDLPSPIVRGMAHDVTEQKRAERELRNAHAQLVQEKLNLERTSHELRLFRTLVDQSNDAIEVVDPETLRFLDVSEKTCADLGYTRQELLSMRVPDIDLNANDAGHARIREAFARSGLIVFEGVHRRKNGSTFPVEVSLKLVPLDRNYIVAVTRDISDRKRVEDALRTSEARFRVALGGSPIKVFNQDRALRYTWVYNLQEGWTEQDYLGKTDDEIFSPEDAARMTELKRQVLEAGQGVRKQITITAHGETYYCDLTVEPLRDAAGDVVGVNCACMDVTDLRKIADELRLAKEKLAEEKLYLEQAIDTELGFGEILGQSSALTAVMQQAGKVAGTDATVLLQGETGTGKEMIARAIHQQSNRHGKSFIKLNCAAIPSGLIESELFGHEKGAFTGAVTGKSGRLELADQGTLFLDEVGELPLELQPKLLRVLQDQEFERLGSNRTRRINIRLIAATNRDLASSVRKNTFRSDLYYRLNVFPIRVPTLRERSADIPLLVRCFVQRNALKMNKSITSIPQAAMDALMAWNWPGNIRELENFIERSVILTEGSVLQVPVTELRSGDKAPAVDDLESTEREHITRILSESKGNISKAAARLGLKRTTLQSMMRRLGISSRANTFDSDDKSPPTLKRNN